ncbi:hypothetical protein ID866_3459 [Astraeus odoratus]|nr:hypothetical protein ID866_3459 [Astraeus odoratus]
MTQGTIHDHSASSADDDVPAANNKAANMSIVSLTPIPVSGSPIIAIDLDDVLSETNGAISEWHNDNYGAPGEMGYHNFYYYFYWKNPFWGTPEITHRKVRKFYETNWVEYVGPVPGAKEGVAALRRLGYRLVIVTARNKSVESASWSWVKQHFGDAFDCIICTGQFASAQKAVADGVYKASAADVNPEVAIKSSKARVCIDIGARLLVDDSVENAMECAKYVAQSDKGTPPQVLLFGSYEWNRRLSQRSEEHDDMAYANRVKGEGGNSFLERDIAHCTEALAEVNTKEILVKRVRDWGEVVTHVTIEKSAGRL